MSDHEMDDVKGLCRWLPTFLGMDNERKSRVLKLINEHNSTEDKSKKWLLRRDIMDILDPPYLSMDDPNWIQAVS